MIEEEWKLINTLKEGLNGIYEVSNLGRVRNIKTGHLFKNNIQKDGYRAVTFKNRVLKVRQTVRTHRLVAIHFLGSPPESSTQVNHKDENKLNNSVENLEWCTYQYNNNYGTARIRAIDTVSLPVCQKTLENKILATYCSAHVAAELLGYPIGTLKAWCRKGIGGGYLWEYLK